MMYGRVKWFSDKLGYGFIESEELDHEVFVHFSQINMKGYKTLQEGDTVEFKLDEEMGKALEVTIVHDEKLETLTVDQK